MIGQHPRRPQPGSPIQMPAWDGSTEDEEFMDLMVNMRATAVITGPAFDMQAQLTRWERAWLHQVTGNERRVYLAWKEQNGWK